MEKRALHIFKIHLLFRDVALINDIFVVLHNELLTHDVQFDHTGGCFWYRVSHGIPILQTRRILLNHVNRLLNARVRRCGWDCGSEGVWVCGCIVDRCVGVRVSVLGDMRVRVRECMGVWMYVLGV